VRVLELGSYHAIVACVASGAGFAIVPQSVLATVQCALVAIHSLPKVLSDVSTPLIWRTGEHTPPVVALRELMRTSSSTERQPPRPGIRGARER
jgi:DNA-binding transcriptional LysR family regulator